MEKEKKIHNRSLKNASVFCLKYLIRSNVEQN